ncbi:biopolymer transporter ExbD [Photobacterium profundum]|uniref:Putative ExbD, Biopolymer transport protein ExbD/TolR n=1 Tax=Photobacterium profundum 3TCK TaxID=314280 RepID=Q1Z8L7_9GAMM|nr:biopolymer transporter ExbD [Photobacterium profundum]EAS45091.1 putative ExbD, Biopolymer transport protein ExbD/TolR [Photobacterium profundum 3TCK]PSV60492.1 biopolymer transporter ExbD [Photobacterium profundum]
MISVSHTYRNDDELKPDLTPLLDIIFIVMVFLLLTASVKLKALDVELPKTETQILQTTEADPITINLIAKEPYWALQGQSFNTWDSFTVALLKQVKDGPTKPVVIGADKNASVEQMLKLLAFLQQHEIKATQLLMEDNA